MAEVPKDINDACQRFRQGDVIEGVPVVEFVDTERPLGTGFAKKIEELQSAGTRLPRHAALAVGANFACIVSQTCDIVQDNKRAIVVAPVISHEDPNDPEVGGESKTKRARREKRIERIEAARSGRRPHIIHIEPFGDERFAAGGFIDLTTLTTIQKPILAGLEPARFIASEEDRRKFAFRCAHIFERPAIPENIVRHVTGPLRNHLVGLEDTGDPRLEVLKAEIGEEWLALDNPETPRAAQLYFLGDNKPSEEAQEIINEWWEEASSAMPEACSLLPCVFASLDSVNLKQSRAMSLLTHWYLSDESPAD
jgi:hypothetical protein